MLLAGSLALADMQPLARLTVLKQDEFHPALTTKLSCMTFADPSFKPLINIAFSHTLKM